MSINCVAITVLPDRYARLRAQGMLTAEELAQILSVTAQTIWRWYRQGRIVGMCYNDRRIVPLSSSSRGGATSYDRVK